MNLIELLKQLKIIESDPSYRGRSRDLILQNLPLKSRRASFSRFFIQSMSVSSSIVLAGLLLVLLLGTLSRGEFLTPFRLSSLNPEGLKAEAEAVDIQIQFTGLNYTGDEFLSRLAQETTTVSIVAPNPLKKSGAKAPAPVEEPITLDEVLLELSR